MEQNRRRERAITEDDITPLLDKVDFFLFELILQESSCMFSIHALMITMSLQSFHSIQCLQLHAYSNCCENLDLFLNLKKIYIKAF